MNCLPEHPILIHKIFNLFEMQTLHRICYNNFKSSQIGRRLLISGRDFTDSESPTAKLLIPEDYPISFRDPNHMYAHPDDYKNDTSPIKPSVFLYRGSMGARERMFIRTSIKLSNDSTDQRFTAATFLFDTGCCPHLNLSSRLQNLLQGRIKKDEGREFFISTTVDDVQHKCITKTDMPIQQAQVNVMGLPMFFALGLSFRKGKVFSFELNQDDIAHDIATFGDFKYL